MTGRNLNRSFLIQEVIQPPVVNHSYPFGNGTNSDNDTLEDDNELYELRPRGKEKIRRNTSRDRLDDIVFVTKEIQEGDTLNAVALQYSCSVADIKRANNFISEQDFFALRSIKIPVKKFSFLREAHSLPKGKHSSRSGPALLSFEHQENVPASDSSSPQKSAGNFLQEVDRDIEQIVKCTNTKRENLNEVVSALSAEQVVFEPIFKERKLKDPYYGADWGIRWWTAVVIMLVVGIITPVFYLLYYEYLMKADVSHHDSTSLVTTLAQKVENDVEPVDVRIDHNEREHNPYPTNSEANLHRPFT